MADGTVEDAALVQLSLMQSTRPDAFGRQLEALVDKLGTMAVQEAGAHAHALLQRAQQQGGTLPPGGDEFGRLEAALVAFAEEDAAAKNPALLAVWVEQWWAVLQTWIRANAAPTMVCEDGGVIADSFDSEQMAGQQAKRPRCARDNEDSQATGSDSLREEENYTRQQEEAWRQSAPASDELQQRARAQLQWESEEVEHQRRAWEAVCEQREKEREAARYKAWEDWTMHVAMHAPPVSASTRVRLKVAVPGEEMRMASVEVGAESLPRGTTIHIEIGEPDPAQTSKDRRERLKDLWRQGQLSNAQAVEEVGAQVLQEWQEWEKGAYRRRRLFNDGPRDDRHAGTPWHRAHFVEPGRNTPNVIPEIEDVTTTTTSESGPDVISEGQRPNVQSPHLPWQGDVEKTEDEDPA